MKIEDLHKGSNLKVDYQCDLCGELANTMYYKYNEMKNKYGKDMCRKCISSNIIQNTRKQNDDNYSRHDTHEKRKADLQNYLLEHKTLNKMTTNTFGKRLYDNFKSYKDDVYDTAMELGYKIEDISKSMPKDYYVRHPEILKEKLISFTDEYKRFPRIKEMEKVLQINTHFISDFGGIDEFKKLINYDDSKDLIDLRGDYNRSIAELITANYFYSQGLKDKYNREQYPFPKEDRYFRSDFTFYLENNKELHVEVWGFRESENSTEKAIHYQNTRKFKEDLYEKYSDDIILISINYELFDKKYDEIQKHLYNLFSPYVNLKFKNVSYKKLLSPSLLTDDELFNEVMIISPDGITLPTTFDLIKHSAGLYYQILKRGYTYGGFAKKFGVKTKQDKIEWSKKIIFEYFSKIINSGKIINKITMNEQYSNLSDAIRKYGNLTKLKIEYFSKINSIPEQELKWIINLIDKDINSTAKYSKKDIDKAKQILEKQKEHHQPMNKPKDLSTIKILLHTKKHSNLLKNITRHIGNLTSDDMEEVLTIFGNDYILGIKYWSGRKPCSVKKYFEMRDEYLLSENKEIVYIEDDFEDNYLSIREVYICASDYDYLINSEDEQKYKYNEDEKEELRKLYLVK